MKRFPPRRTLNNAEKGILVAVIIFLAGAYGEGWTVRPQVTYSIEYQYGTPTPYYVTAGYVANGSYLQNTSPLTVSVAVDNQGGTPITFDITVSGTNATISNSEAGHYGSFATETLLVQAKDSFSASFYVLPYLNTPSFKLLLTTPQTIYGSDPVSDLIYFVYSSSIYSPVNLQSLTYVRTSPSSNAYNPQS
jgi:hypothetical protein